MSPRLAQTDLDLRVLLGHVLIAKRGYANSAVQDAFEAALSAAEGRLRRHWLCPLFEGLHPSTNGEDPSCGRQQSATGSLRRWRLLQNPCLLADAWRRRLEPRLYGRLT